MLDHYLLILMSIHLWYARLADFSYSSKDLFSFSHLRYGGVGVPFVEVSYGERAGNE